MRWCLMTLLVAIASVHTGGYSQEFEAREHARAAAVAAGKTSTSAAPIVLQEPARSYFEWGAIVSEQGEVLNVRPGSVAAIMGLQPRDQLTHVNNKLFEPGKLAQFLTHIAELEHNQQFVVGIIRDSQTLQLTGTVQANVIPGWRLEVFHDFDEASLANENQQQCGRLSVFFTPPAAADLHPALINSVAGDNVRIQNPTIKLAAQEYRIGVHELIQDPSVRRGRGIAPEKYLTLTIEPNKTYHIAAKFIPAKRFKYINAEYWEPVVWKVTEQNCQLD